MVAITWTSEPSTLCPECNIRALIPCFQENGRVVRICSLRPLPYTRRKVRLKCSIRTRACAARRSGKLGIRQGVSSTATAALKKCHRFWKKRTKKMGRISWGAGVEQCWDRGYLLYFRTFSVMYLSCFYNFKNIIRCSSPGSWF